MRVIENIPEMQKLADKWRAQGEGIVLVPTMGFLHEGHLDLIRTARKVGAKTVISIFVNPTSLARQRTSMPILEISGVIWISPLQWEPTRLLSLRSLKCIRKVSRLTSPLLKSRKICAAGAGRNTFAEFQQLSPNCLMP